jgi:uncharacterized membrane protein
MKTIAAVFPNLTQAGQACRDLEHIGIPRDDISLIAGNDKGKHNEYLAIAKKASTPTEAAAASGAALGGGLGMLATLATIAIPGVGPIVALGPLFTVLLGLGVGATAGGLIGTFHNLGISHDEAPLYEEAVRRGEVMVAAVVDEQFQLEAVAVLQRNGSRDVRNELDAWAETEWSGPKRDPHPYVSDSGKRKS